MANKQLFLNWDTISEIAKYQSVEQKLIYDYPDYQVCTYPSEHNYCNDMYVLLVDHNAALEFPIHEELSKIPKNFIWAEDSIKALAEEWDKMMSTDSRVLIDNFRKRGGILCLTPGYADVKKLINVLNNSNEKTMDTMSLDYFIDGMLARSSDDTVLLKNISFIVTLSTNRDKKSILLHELTHAADTGISNSILFKACYSLDGIRRSPFLDEIITLTENLLSCPEAQINQELLARLNEERYTDPRRFKKEAPLLDAFFSKVLYPALNTLTVAIRENDSVASKDILEILQNQNLFADKVLPLTDNDLKNIDQSPAVTSISSAMDEFQTKMEKYQKEISQKKSIIFLKKERAILNYDGSLTPVNGSNPFEGKEAYSPATKVSSNKNASGSLSGISGILEEHTISKNGKQANHTNSENISPKTQKNKIFSPINNSNSM